MAEWSCRVKLQSWKNIDEKAHHSVPTNKLNFSEWICHQFTFPKNLRYTQKFCKVLTTKKHGLLPNDFVMVVYESQGVRRYGIVKDIPSSHNVNVKILHKRSVGKEQSYAQKVEQFSVNQVKLIYRVPKNKDT